MELSFSYSAEPGVPLDLGQCSRGKLWSCPKEGKPLIMYDGERWMLLEQCRGSGPHFELIWGTRNSFIFLRSPQGPFSLVTVFLGTLWNSIKEVKGSVHL